MKNNFRIVALDNELFSDYFNLSDKELSKQNISRMIVDKFPGYPCRVSLTDVQVGEEVILLNFEHHSANSPYKASGPIFISKNAQTYKSSINEIPIMFNRRFLSIRAYNKNSIMIFADAIKGDYLKEKLNEILENQEVEYIHIHNARPGCYNCLVERA
ncbi:DUF1203 domain-containing protein [Empedobacter sp. GD03644]|uniref:DUF1203 domain-containing protein n=1 Tax=Empedobacter sp. GD03644 TaxID=2975358 RepID=UPI002449C590|nr:DUF1203 domain-containing protein [Empedobacter sp. GD03644]MDH2207955.1 DUF1203 domain-containing protein [Empedobacter sp. GD03644]